MEEARKKLRVCLICVVAVAVIVGAVYYFHDIKGGQHISEGTLVTIPLGGSPHHLAEGGASVWL